MRFLLPVALLFLAACGNNNNGTKSNGFGTEQGAEIPADSNNWYKRYTGTVAGQAVVANIQMRDGAVSGNYYYVSQGKLINIMFTPDSAKPGVYNVDEAPEEVEAITQSQWEVSINDQNISGMWKDALGNKVYDIMLKEDEQGSNLRVYSFSDSIPNKAGQATPYASFEMRLLVPAPNMPKEQAAFLSGIVGKEIDCTEAQKDLQQCATAQSAKYATEYRGYIDSTEPGLRGEAFNNHYASQTMDVAYNDNGWLVLEVMNAGYTGGAHGNYAGNYLNLDMENNKLWKLEEVLTVDSVKLSNELNAAARKRYRMPATEPLEGHYFDNSIGVNGNFYLTHKGISFCYNPYEIASYAQGQIKLFIPYANISDLLTPAFKERMKLK